MLAARVRGHGLVKQFGVGLNDVVPQWLKREPAREGIAGLLTRVAGVVGVHEFRSTGRLGQQLRLTRALHRDEPPRRFVNRLTNREQSVILVNGGLLVAEALGENASALLIEHDASASFSDEHVVLEEDAGVLGEWVELSTE